MSANAPGSGIDVFIPWRPHPSREASLLFALEWWESHGFATHLIDTEDQPFNLAACRNLGVRSASSHVVILADADTVPELPALLQAMSLASDELGTVLPYTEYRSLGARGSADARIGRDLDACPHLIIQDACSGIYVTTRAGWAKHHGQDELFAGWGCEDAAWWIAHETLVGVPRRVRGHVFALTHESQDKDGEPTRSNYARIFHYEQARGDRARILELLTGMPQ